MELVPEDIFYISLILVEAFLVNLFPIIRSVFLISWCEKCFSRNNIHMILFLFLKILLSCWISQDKMLIKHAFFDGLGVKNSLAMKIERSYVNIELVSILKGENSCKWFHTRLLNSGIIYLIPGIQMLNLRL